MAVKCKVGVFCLALTLFASYFKINVNAQDFGFGSFSKKPNLYLTAGFEKPSTSKNSPVKLIIYGQLEEGWHLYSVQSHPHLNIIPTSVVYQNIWYQKQGGIIESQTELLFDEALGVEVQTHRKQFQLQQTLLIRKDAPVGNLDLTGYVQYQVCNQKVCLEPQQTSFVATIKVVK